MGQKRAKSRKQFGTVTVGMLSSIKTVIIKTRLTKIANQSLYHRMLYTVTAVLSLISELISVMWSTVAVNKLIETKILPSASVW